jgi:hypothetical protein
MKSLIKIAIGLMKQLCDANTQMEQSILYTVIIHMRDFATFVAYYMNTLCTSSTFLILEHLENK